MGPVTFSFEKMIAWQKGIEFVDEVFEVADHLPQRYQFSIGEQLRRAALSITNNLAEGSGRGTPGLQRNFYDIARGSAFEVVSILAVMSRRKLIEETQAATLRKQAVEIVSIIFGLLRALPQSVSKAVREEIHDYETDSLSET